MMYVVLFLVLLVAGGSFSVSDSLFSSESLVFKSSMTFVNTSSLVSHMEEDMYSNDGGIIFSDTTTLKTVSKDQRTSTVASGFRHVTGFKQINLTHLAVTDYWAHCLKMINREDRSVSWTAGQFNRSGYSDGSPGLFNFPWSVEIDVRRPGNLLITDYRNAALRSVNINTGAVSTVIGSGFLRPKGMTWHKDRLLVVNSYYISEVVWTSDNTVTNTILTGSNRREGNVDGSFSLSRFYNPRDIHPISEYMYLVADEDNENLRLLDISKQQVLPVCTNNILQCNKSTTKFYPRSLLTTDDAVYVGRLGKITKLTGAVYIAASATQTCEDRNISVTLSDGETKTVVEVSAGKWLTLEAGTYKYTDSSNGNCTVSVNVEAVYIPTQTCEDKNISVTLSYGETKTVVEVSAGKWLTLEAGAYIYTDSSNGNCTVSVNVASNFTCPASITVIASNSTGVASIDWPVKESEDKLLLPIGRFSYRMPYRGKICDVTINVIEALNTTPKKDIAILPIGILSGILASALVVIAVLVVVISRLRSALRSQRSSESTNQTLMSPDLELASAVNANDSEYEAVNSNAEDSHIYSVL